jgi:hypothetical protein
MDDQPVAGGADNAATSLPDLQLIRAAVEAEVKDLLNQGLTRDDLVSAVSDRMFLLASEMMMRTFTYHLAQYLADLPEADRKARAIEILNQVSTLGLGSTESGTSGQGDLE